MKLGHITSKETDEVSTKEKDYKEQPDIPVWKASLIKKISEEKAHEHTQEVILIY